jgi:uncharacterized protein with HEPN domain
MTDEQIELLGGLLKAISRIERKSQPLLSDPSLLDSEVGQDALDVICMQFMAVGEGLKRFERHWPGVLASQFPQVDWKGAMGFRDVIAHQYFDLDEEQVLLICEQSLPEMAAALRRLAET